MLPAALTQALADAQDNVGVICGAIVLIVVVFVAGALIRRLISPMGASLAGWRAFAKWKNDSSR